MGHDLHGGDDARLEGARMTLWNRYTYKICIDNGLSYCEWALQKLLRSTGLVQLGLLFSLFLFHCHYNAVIDSFLFIYHSYLPALLLKFLASLCIDVSVPNYCFFANIMLVNRCIAKLVSVFCR